MDLILRHIRNGDQEAFSGFFEAHHVELVKYAFRFLYDQEACEDVVQEVFISLWENRNKLDIKSSLRNYLFSMVRNKCIDHLRKLSITSGYELLDASIQISEDIPKDLMHQDEKEKYLELVRNILSELPGQMQNIVYLRYFDELSYKEIANELEISVNTVKTQLKRAKIKFESCSDLIPAGFSMILLILSLRLH